MNIRGSFLSAVLAMTVLSSCKKVDTANDWIYQLDDDQLAILKYLRPLTLKSSPLQFLANKRSSYFNDFQYLRDPKFLPVHFLVDGKSSDDLTWIESGHEYSRFVSFSGFGDDGIEWMQKSGYCE